MRYIEVVRQRERERQERLAARSAAEVTEPEDAPEEEPEVEEKMAPAHENKMIEPPDDKAWPLKMPPPTYLGLHPDGKWADLARELVDADA